MALRVTFGRPRGDPATLGPYAQLQFFGHELRAGTEPHPIAVHADHHWVMRSERYSRVDIAGPVYVELSRPEHPARTYGPFTAFSCVDGVAYAEGRVFAFVDSEHVDWYCIEDNRHWKALTLTENRPR